MGKAYRNGELDRSGYIRQRRDMIDAITNREIVASRAAQQADDDKEPTTIVRAVESFNGTVEDE